MSRALKRRLVVFHALLAVTGAAMLGSCSGGGGGGPATVPWGTFQQNSIRTGVSTGEVINNPGTATLLFQIASPTTTLSTPILAHDGIIVGTPTGLLALTTRGDFRWSFESYSRKCLRSDNPCVSNAICNQFNTGDTCLGCTVCTPETPGCLAVGPISASPTASPADDVIVGTEGGQVFGLIDNGNSVTCQWVANARDSTLAPIRSSAGVLINSSDSTIATAIFGTGSGFLLALNGFSGNSVWRFPSSGSLGPITSSPVVASAGSTFFTAQDGSLQALTIGGDPLWSVQVGTGGADTPFIPSPALGPSLYATGPDGDAGVLMAVNLDGSVKWRFNTDAPVLGSPVYAQRTVTFIPTPSVTPGPPPTPTPTPPNTLDTVVYTVDESGTLYAVRDLTGQAIAPPVAVAGNPPSVRSSPVLSSDLYVIVVGTDGRLYASTFDGIPPCNPCTHNTPSEWPVNLGSPIRSSPIINTDGRIYVTTDNGALYMIGPPF